MKIEFNEIDFSLPYNGYLWMSNETDPIVLDGVKSVIENSKNFYSEKYDNDDKFVDIRTSINPFIIEGQLCDGKTSISIKFVDGKYIVNKYDLSEIESLECTNESFVPNRMDNIVKLNFKRVWRPVTDDLCEDMEVLKPAELVFVGFEKKGGKQ